MHNGNGSSNGKPQYHYDMLEANRAKVRDQAQAINRNLKRLVHISETDLEVPDDELELKIDDDITQQFVTMPPTEPCLDRRLESALEEAKAERSLATDSLESVKSKKKWYSWND